jgi:chaperonin GroES
LEGESASNPLVKLLTGAIATDDSPRSAIYQGFCSETDRNPWVGRFPACALRRSEAMAATSVTTTFTPLHDRILVRRVEETETIRGGIIIPDSAKEKPQEGEVISVGKGKSNDEGKVFPLDVKAGDRVLFGKYSGTEIKIDGEEFLIMREEEVLGIVKK